MRARVIYNPTSEKRVIKEKFAGYFNDSRASGVMKQVRLRPHRSQISRT